MGTTFVAIGERGFWMRDGVLELWLRLLALHVDDPDRSRSATVAGDIRDQWLVASRGYFNGCVPVGLHEAVSTPEGRELVVRSIESLLKALSKAPPTLDKGVLNVLGMDGEFGQDFETSGLLQVGQAFLDLVDGKIGSDASDTSFMPGSTAGPASPLDRH